MAVSNSYRERRTVRELRQWFALPVFRSEDDTCSGVAVERTLETELGYGGLGRSWSYPNLDTLGTKGLVAISQFPGTSDDSKE
ncbi:hypothetical protein [Halorussus halophilus]|uniref:hypothetical protein n=1 Tax=Halorussus halophilus TaxID=2650975 RepID=UPI001301569D|nr:hypothetical protein [Halorussus halophilus]